VGDKKIAEKLCCVRYYVFILQKTNILEYAVPYPKMEPGNGEIA